MRAWYCPSWNGDWRLEPEPNDPARTRITVVKPTLFELQQLAQLAKPFGDKGWLDAKGCAKLVSKPGLFSRQGHHVTLNAPLPVVGPLVTALLQPGPAILTAVRFTDGHIEVCETAKADPGSALPTAGPIPGPADGSTPIPEPYRTPSPVPALPAASTAGPPTVATLAAKPDADKAVTVKRPTPCCPPCYVDAIGPATEVLLSFLDEEQHASWAQHRAFIAYGGLSRHRYLLAHRHSPTAAAQERIAFDLDDGREMHFHDWTVPPEEEVLAAMLILQHREPWLRNEATALGPGRRHVFKNPFGDGGDGVADSSWTWQLGAQLDAWRKVL